MQPMNEWLTGRNLQEGRREAPLEGEALAYSLVTFACRPERLPDEVVVALAEEFFSRVASEGASA